METHSGVVEGLKVNVADLRHFEEDPDLRKKRPDSHKNEKPGSVKASQCSQYFFYFLHIITKLKCADFRHAFQCKNMKRFNC